MKVIHRSIPPPGGFFFFLNQVLPGNKEYFLSELNTFWGKKKGKIKQNKKTNKNNNNNKNRKKKQPPHPQKGTCVLLIVNANVGFCIPNFLPRFHNAFVFYAAFTVMDLHALDIRVTFTVHPL